MPEAKVDEELEPPQSFPRFPTEVSIPDLRENRISATYQVPRADDTRPMTIPIVRDLPPVAPPRSLADPRFADSVSVVDMDAESDLDAGTNESAAKDRPEPRHDGVTSPGARQTLLFTPIRRQWHLILLVVAMCCAAAAGYTVTRQTLYTSTSQMIVTVNGAQGVDEIERATLLAREKAASYARLVNSDEVLNRVTARYSLSGLSEVRARVPAGGNVIVVTVIDGDPERSAAIANAVTETLPAAVRELEGPKNSSVSPVQVTTLSRASVPARPSSPRTMHDLIVGLIFGLLAGIAGAYLRARMRVRLRSPAQIEALTGAVPLGVIPFDAATESSPLAESKDSAARVKAFQQLTVNLRFTGVDHQRQIILVTSAGPGEGKSTTACNLAFALASSGISTCLIDADLRKQSTTQYMGISSRAGLTDVLVGQLAVDDALAQLQRLRMAIIPPGSVPPNPSELLGSLRMRELLSGLRGKFDVIIIDSRSTLDADETSALATVADGVLLVTRHGKTTDHDLGRALRCVSLAESRVLGTVVNVAPVKGKLAQEYADALSPFPPVGENPSEAS